MENVRYLFTGLALAFQPTNIIYCFVGVAIGTLIGVLPGIGPLGGIALLLPITFKAPALGGIIMLCGILYGTQYGGSTTSILVNIPGEAASVITTLDGYQMARKGRAGPALGIAAFGSFIAGTAAVFGLVFLAPTLSEFALKFGPPEYFCLMAFGMTMVIYLARSSMSRAVMMSLFGFILSTVGFDPMTTKLRFSCGLLCLRDGLDLAPVVIGLYGISEVLLSVERGIKPTILETEKIVGILPTRQDWKDSIFPIIRSSILGFVLAVIPGVSTIIPTFIVYSIERRISKHPEEFGTGVIEGVAAPESANNAACIGTLVPLLSLGIPTGATTALLFGALMIHGITPGPMLIKESPEIFWGLIGSMYIGNAMLLVLNLPLIGIWIKVLRIPYAILFALILFFCLIGTYVVGRGPAEMYVMIIFGLLGYLMKKFQYEASPLVLALVLGPLMESALRRSLFISNGSFLIFFQRPISMVFMVLVLLMLISPFVLRRRVGQEIVKNDGN